MVFSFIGGLFEKVFTVVLTVAAVQIPRFLELYVHLVKGALHEAGKNLSFIQKNALSVGLSMDDFIQKHLDSQQEIYRQSGMTMQKSVERYQEYKKVLASFDSSSAWEKPVVFLQNLDWELAGKVNFSPGLPITTESIIYALLGLLLSMLLVMLIKLPFKFKKKRSGSRVMPHRQMPPMRPPPR